MKSVILTAGTYAEVYLAYLQEAGVEVIGFLDDNPHSSIVRGKPVLGKISELVQMKERYGVEAVYCPLGNNALRVKFLEQARSQGYETPNFIHPTVNIAPNVTIAEQGVYILQGTVIMPFATIDKDVMISVNSIVCHHSHLSQGVFISSGVTFGANICAEKYAYCGMGCTLMTGFHTLGENCLIGGGAVVIRDVEPNAVMAGVPAKVLKYKTLPNVVGGGKLELRSFVALKKRRLSYAA